MAKKLIAKRDIVLIEGVVHVGYFINGELDKAFRDAKKGLEYEKFLKSIGYKVEN